MVEINIDPSSITSRFDLSQDDVNDLLDFTIKELTARYANELENEAYRTLKSGRQEYISNIIVVDEGFAKGAVVINGWLPNALEEGKEPYDMKVGFFTGPNAKTSKDGFKYNTIPFRHGTPTAQAENFNGGIMPKEVYDIVKNRNADEPLTTYDLKNVSKKFTEPKTKKIELPDAKGFKEYQHKHGFYEGLTKKTDSKTGQNSYVTFRRVSENTEGYEYSWIHPGFPATNLMDKTLQEFNIPAEIGKILDKLL